MTLSIRLPRGLVNASLASVYILGFIITPYWLLHKSVAEVIFFLALTIITGFIWLLLSTNALQVEFNFKNTGLFLLLLAGMTALNYRALNSVIPFRGDEALHIERTLELASRIPALPTLVIVILFITFIVAGIKKQAWAFYVGIFMLICVIFYFLGENLFKDLEKYPKFFLRYPFINYWFFAVAPKLASSISSPYHEVLYRIVPFLSMVGLAWVVQKKSGLSHLPSNMAWGFAIATIPLVFYYSSILYLEPPAVLLMTIVCFDINNLLHKDSKDISQVPSWYALVLIGFIKETAIPFLLCFIAVRSIVQLQNWSKRTFTEKTEKRLVNVLAGELQIIFSLLAPALLYLYFRISLASARSFHPQILNLLDLRIYWFIILSFIEQFGPFLLFFIGGCILLIINKRFSALFFYISLILFILAFHAVDDELYIGYSRFNLFILPAILAGSVSFIAWAAKQRPVIGTMLVLITIAGNLLLSPVYLDGAKVPYWGNHLADTSEHYYPYQDALVWLKNNYPKKRMLVAGLDFYYPLQFYWNKLDWKPRKDGASIQGVGDETLAISKILEEAENKHYSVVVYRVVDKDLVLPEETGEFRIQVIKNSAHTLLIFYKP